MTHYTEHICKYDTADNVNTEHNEVTYKYLIKVYFNQINKQKIFQQQLLLHNTHCLNLLTIKDIILHSSTRDSQTSHNAMTASVIKLSWVYQLKKLQSLLRRSETSLIQSVKLNLKMWCSVSTLTDIFDILSLLDALTDFVKKHQNAMNSIAVSDKNSNYRVKESS